MSRKPYHSDREVQTRQQLLGEKWWTTRFLNMMRPGHDTTHLIKGRRLADRGQVILNSVFAGGADAIILEALGGSRKTSLWLTDLEENWDVVYRIFADHQDLYSRLLQGEYPEELDDMLEEAGISIIPTTPLDLDYRCDCTYHDICSHIIATYMALGRKIEDDPMILFLLRGKTGEEIMAGVSAITDPITDDLLPVIPVSGGVEDTLVSPDPVRYYSPDPDCMSVRIRTRFLDERPVQLIRLLGPSPFMVGDQNLSGYIEQIYPKVVRYLRNLHIDPAGDEGTPD